MNKRIFSTSLLAGVAASMIAGRGIAADAPPPNLCKRQRQVAPKSHRSA